MKKYKNLFMLLLLTCIVENLFAQSNVFNFYQPQNYNGSNQQRPIKNLQVKVDTITGNISSEELLPILSTYPFTGQPHGAVLVNDNLIVSCAANGFTGLSSFNTQSGKNINNKKLANTGELIHASNIYNFYTTHTDFKKGAKVDSVSCINSQTFNIKWAKELVRNGTSGVVGHYLIDDMLLMVGLINNNVSSIIAFHPSDGSPIPVNNNGFTFTNSFRVVSSSNNAGYIVAFERDAINIATYSLEIQDNIITQINISPLNRGYFTANSNALFVKYNSQTVNYPNGYLTVYTCDNSGLFTRVILNLGTAADNIPSTIQLNTQGEPYDIIERQTIINGVTYNIVFVARTSSDKTASDVAIIPEFSQPIFSYFGFNRQAIGLIIVN